MKIARVEVECFKCCHDFTVELGDYPLLDEGGYYGDAICPECGANCGVVTVRLLITKPKREANRHE